jgi:uncharacterized protein
MPLPTPKKTESKKDFTARCMANEVMKSQFSNKDQRYRVCISIWEKKEKNMDGIKSNKNISLEERHLTAEESRLAAQGGKQPKILGYAAVFKSLSEPLAGGAFREKIEKGAFAESLRVDDVKCLFNHDDNYVLGRKGNSTLALSEDDRGLYFEVLPPETQWAADLMVSIGRKDIYQGSFQFKVLEDSWDSSDPDNVVRTLIRVKLIDVSVVSFPAYPQTEVDLRSEWQVYEDYSQNLKVQQDQLLNKERAARQAQVRSNQLREQELQNIKLEEERWKSYLKS